MLLENVVLRDLYLLSGSGSFGLPHNSFRPYKKMTLLNVFFNLLVQVLHLQHYVAGSKF